MDQVFELCDELGPEKVLHVAVPGGPRGILVIDNLALGPAIGGVRVAKDATLSECARLARAMTLKNAAAGLPHGGGKSVILEDPAAPLAKKEKFVRAFARAIEGETGYIPGPDMGLDERAMAWMLDEIGRAVGLPKSLGGLAIDEIGATGFGLVSAAEAAEAFGGPKLDGATVVVQGFGAVGSAVARYLSEKGATIVAAADSSGAVADPNGLDLDALRKAAAKGLGRSDIPGAMRIDGDALIGVKCDIWIPAARPDVLNERNVGRLRTKMVLQGANIPATAGAEAAMDKAGILVIPDFIANAGGVIAAAVEHVGGDQKTALAEIDSKIRRNTAEMLTRARDKGVSPRAAAFEMAVDRVRAAMARREDSAAA